MMDPIKFKDEAYQAKTRAALPKTQDEWATAGRSSSVAVGPLPSPVLMLRQLELRVVRALPPLAARPSAKPSTAASAAVSCSCC